MEPWILVDRVASGQAEAETGQWVAVTCDPQMAITASLADWAMIFQAFGDVTSIDMTRCKTDCVVSVRYMTEESASALRTQLVAGHWRPSHIRPDQWLSQSQTVERFPRGSPQEREHLEVKEQRLQRGEEHRRTVMVGQIPRSCDAIQILDALHSLGLMRRLCFFYLPVDRARRRHCGYAFIEFNDPMDVLSLHQSLPTLVRMLCRNNERPMHVHFARIQGWRTFIRTMVNDLNFIFEPNANIRPQLFLPQSRLPKQASLHDLLFPSSSIML
ncbi:unnamed protein product [Cladocopium goreaui]|uniref:Protein MEI2-like 3 (OML3) (MEI2-like protein 3) n=1 Tax=Cladocopium goreaui TaxID=2562237 RepID=A0A9P1FGW6_9DINO|nr:unnamed protein product [Cladocopium goreaui]